MAGGGEALGGIEVLIDVAERVWLPVQQDRRQDESDMMVVHAHRAEARARLMKISSKLGQIDEIDARIALLEITPGIPARDALVARLKKLRSALLKAARE